MKNKKVIFFILLIILSFGTISVKADRIERKGRASITVKRELTNTGIYIGTTDNQIPLNVFDVNFNGSTYLGYCLDYSYKASHTLSYTCTPDTHRAAAALTYAYNHRTFNNLTDSLAMRFIAIRLDKSKPYHGAGGRHGAQNILVWLEIQTGQASADDNPPSKSLTTRDDDTLEALNKAFALSTAAIENTESSSSLETASNSLTFTNKRVSGKQVTYTVKANNPIDKSNIAFTCNGCNIKNNIQDTWTGTEGTLIVEDTGDDCSYELNAFYPGSGAYTCTAPGDDNQQIEIFVGAASTSGGIDTNGSPTQVYADTISEGDYYTGTCGPSGFCKTIPDDKVNINNCCEDNTTSTVDEPILNDLFCNDTDLKVDYYKLNSGIGKYLETNTDLDSNYCQMYCTERMQVDIPEALTATNGKYFQLSQNKVSGTYAPHMQSTKRCRIRVEYDKWSTDYKNQVDASVSAYNEYQKNKAYQSAYDDAASKETESNKKSATISVRCQKDNSCKTYGPYKADGSRECIEENDDGYDETRVFTFHYYAHDFLTYHYTKVKRSGNERENGMSVISDGSESIRLSSTYRILDYDSVSTSIGHFENSRSCGYNGGSGKTMFESYENARNTLNDDSKSESEKASARNTLNVYEDNVESKANYYSSQAITSSNAYNAAVSQIESLQQTLTRCDKYFVDDSVSNTNSAEQMYNLPTSLSSFKYTQIYQDDYGNPKQTQVTVGFDGSCQYTKEVDVNNVDTFARSGTGTGLNYSAVYGNGYARMNVLGKTLSYSNTTDSSFYTRFINPTYTADKMFWHDGKYTATCDWNRTDVDKYTVGTDGKVVTTNPSTDDSAYRLVPRGEVYNYKSSLVNYSEHEFVFSFSTSYDGKFETYWDLKGLGENSKFDKYFEDGAGTCANQNPGDTSLLTCSLSSFHGGSFYGCCCGDSNGTTYSTTTCDPYNDKAVKYEFKIVDPAKVFPADTDGYADNWKTATGQKAREAIEELGKNLSTYSPKTLSYSFVLTPSDMKQIKKYNSILNSYGGYTDSDLTCDCSEAQGDSNKDNGKSCVKCTSSFLDNLSNGKILKDETLTGGWNRSDKSIAEVRKSGNVIWAVNK